MTDKFKKINNINIVWLVLGLLIGIFIANKVDTTHYDEEAAIMEKLEETEETSEETTIMVYITGEVKNPDVYSMPENARLNDLVEKAGGFTDKAYTDNLNYAKILDDGSKVVIRSVDDVLDANGNLKDSVYGKAVKDKININTADSETLAELDGLNEELAENIVTYRKDYGDYTSIEEIKEAEGIGDVVFGKIKDKITIE